MSYSPRLVKPEKGNKYYITKSNGGYSNAIVGKPTDCNCNTLANCSGYAHGRFHEIIKDPKMSYLCPVNAEDFPKYAKKCEQGTTPKLGSVIVWQKGKTEYSKDGVGHVAIVERILSENQILISQSGYNNKNIFWTEICTFKNNNWTCSWMSNNYKFECFIYNPGVSKEDELIITLMKGSKGKLVKELQTNLNTIGNYKLSIDGLFGTTCDKAVKDFQRKNGLVEDGIVGPATQSTISTKIKELEKPDKVEDLEVLVDGKKYSVWATNIENCNYIRLKDLTTLGLAKSVEWNSTKKMPEIKTK